MIQLRVYFLGTGGAGGPSNRAHNCFIVESKECRLLIDFGEGCSWRLEELGLTLCDIDLVYISHKHIDHWVGLFDSSVFALSKGCKSFNVLAHDDVLNDLSNLVTNTLPLEISRNVKFKIIHDKLTIHDLMLEVIPSCHPVPTYGLIISDRDSTIYYTADTSVYEGLINGLKRADLVIHEASLPDELSLLAKQKGHTTVSQALSQTRYMKSGAIIALVHLTTQSLKQLISGKVIVPQNNVKVIVPQDGTVLMI